MSILKNKLFIGLLGVTLVTVSTTLVGREYEHAVQYERDEVERKTIPVEAEEEDKKIKGIEEKMTIRNGECLEDPLLSDETIVEFWREMVDLEEESEEIKSEQMNSLTKEEIEKFRIYFAEMIAEDCISSRQSTAKKDPVTMV